jgi:hypothetical protein
VKWSCSTRPTKSGRGLGIHHLVKLARALQIGSYSLRNFECEEERTLSNFETPCDMTDRLLFDAVTSITVGDGMRTSF